MGNPGKRIPEAQRDNIRTYLSVGKTHKWIAEHLGCNINTVGDVFRDMAGSAKELLAEANELLKVHVTPAQDRRNLALINRITTYLNLKKKRRR